MYHDDCRVVVCWTSCEIVAGVMGGGGGWEYSWSGSLHFSVSASSFSGRKGNFYVICCIDIDVLFCVIKLYISLWMVLGGLVMFWFFSRNCV